MSVHPIAADADVVPITGGGRTLEFHLSYPLDDLRPADYNPRRLSETAFARLQESIGRWGIVKPVILNADGTLVAGHQRTKAMRALGITHTPAVRLSAKVRMADEVQFNLMHNRVEVEASEVMVPFSEPGEWAIIDPEDIRVGSRAAAAFRAAMGSMVAGHGAWGAVVCDDQGRVVLNTEYAVVCADMKMPLLAYTIPVDAAQQLYSDLTGEYGVYDWSGIADTIAPVYNQHYAQLHRLVERDKTGSAGQKGDVIFKSSTWEQHVLPWLTKAHRVADFGAGYGDYAKRLRGEGFTVCDYEPFRCTDGAYHIDIKQVVGMIRTMQRSIAADGLFDVVVLDSVINSITTNAYQDAVLTMVNALCRRDGVVVLGTRTRYAKERVERAKTSSTRSGHGAGSLGFLDDDGVEFKFAKGKWGAQRYHTPESLRALLDRFFEDVTMHPGDNQMWASCRQPRHLPLEQIRDAANIEFNMPYPNDYRHNRHEAIVAELLRRCEQRGSTWSSTDAE